MGWRVGWWRQLSQKWGRVDMEDPKNLWGGVPKKMGGMKMLDRRLHKTWGMGLVLYTQKCACVWGEDCLKYVGVNNWDGNRGNDGGVINEMGNGKQSYLNPKGCWHVGRWVEGGRLFVILTASHKTGTLLACLKCLVLNLPRSQEDEIGIFFYPWPNSLTLIDLDNMTT